MIKNAVICAAGLGSRLGLNMPKCLVKIGKHRLIYYLLKQLEDVENVRIVVGYKEDEVIDYVKEIRSDVVFVRNPHYDSTTNAYSLYLGTRDLKEPYLTIDGDMIVDPSSFKLFKKECSKINSNLIGITKAKTDDAVFVKVNNQQEVVAFTRLPESEWEWTGISYFCTVNVNKEGNYVYQELEPHLPLKHAYIKCYEIDTPNDLQRLHNEIDFELI